MMIRTAAVCAAALAGLAIAQQFDVVITSGTSTLASTATFTTAGTLIGDYDPDTNPTGTQTRPGFFGGSGNNPIDASAEFALETGGTTSPTGTFRLTVDFGSQLAQVELLSMDLLGGQELPSELAVTLLYDTFHTASPTFIYPGGVPITLPLGQLGAIRNATAVQSGPAIGALTATGDPNAFDVLIAVPVEATFDIELTPLGADPIAQTVGPFPLLLPLAGQLTIVDSSHLQLSTTLGPQTSEQTLPLDPPLELPALPLELPTLGADTAGVVLTLAADALQIETALEIAIIADGTRSACTADWNSDGVLNFFDVQGFLNDFSAHDPRADLAGPDGQFDFFDVQAFLQLFSAGCP
ncbi:MAG: hypothetical protein Kow0022_00260 [Phycisphaerales bacterium]